MKRMLYSTMTSRISDAKHIDESATTCCFSQGAAALVQSADHGQSLIKLHGETRKVVLFPESCIQRKVFLTKQQPRLQEISLHSSKPLFTLAKQPSKNMSNTSNIQVTTRIVQAATPSKLPKTENRSTYLSTSKLPLGTLRKLSGQKVDNEST